VATVGPLTIQCDDAQCPTDESNLVWRAAVALCREAGRRGVPSGVRVTLEKRIPIQAGLGGGSSDAAAALRGLAAFWNLSIGPDRLAALAGALGTDVPFFLEGGTTLGLDRGETLFPLADLPASWVLLVIPSFGVSTPDAYRWWDERTGTRAPRAANDLEAPVAARHPEIARIVKRLTRLGAASASMSGSGSAVFGLFDVEQAALEAARGLKTASQRAIVTRTTTRRQHGALARPR
jgi:4-diphosphocytidyl-2-C-methyl-D-erythritol kinase